MRARIAARRLPLALAALLAIGVVQAAGAAGEPEPAGEPEIEADLFGEGDPLESEADLEAEVASDRRDPFEGLNRDVFAFNRRVDYWFFDPITRGYQFVVPEAGRRALYRASMNLDSPVILANHMLQFRVVPAAATATRFVINTTIGCAGLFDPAATYFEVPRVEGDFGQTLARYGAPSGPYLMLPIFGPSTVRDVFGDVVDIIVDPVSYVLGPLQWWTLVLGGGEGLIYREAHLGELEALEDASLDFYSALRSAYLQSRDAAVREARGELRSDDLVSLDVEMAAD